MVQIWAFKGFGATIMVNLTLYPSPKKTDFWAEGMIACIVHCRYMLLGGEVIFTFGFLRLDFLGNKKSISHGRFALQKPYNWLRRRWVLATFLKEPFRFKTDRHRKKNL